MQRIDQYGKAMDLPTLECTGADAEDLHLYLRVMLGAIETGDMFHGRFVEVVVGRAIAADISTTGINEWDLLVPGEPPITVEVKSTTVGGSFKLPPKKAQVWVFAACVDKSVRPREFSFVVASAAQVKAIGSQSIKQKKAFAAFGPTVDREGLLTAVKAASGAS